MKNDSVWFWLSISVIFFCAALILSAINHVITTSKIDKLNVRIEKIEKVGGLNE